jgi:hypothetical protein
VVDGVLDPIAWSTGGAAAKAGPCRSRLGLHSDEGAQATLNEFFRLCDAAGARVRLLRSMPHGASRPLRSASCASPWRSRYPMGRRCSSTTRSSSAHTLGALYDSLFWPEFADVLADVEARSRRHLLRSSGGSSGSPGAPHSRTRSYYPNFLEGFPGVACSDSDNPHRYSAWSINGALAEPGSATSAGLDVGVEHLRGVAGRDEDSYTGPFNPHDRESGAGGRQPLRPGHSLRGGRDRPPAPPRSALLTLDGWGHTSLFLSQCVDAAVSRYLLTRATPPRGATCEQDVVPFTPVATRSDARQQRLRRLSMTTRVG